MEEPASTQDLSRATENRRPGRPSKGQRSAMITRVPTALGVLARDRAARLGLTVSDYLQSLVPRDLSLREPDQRVGGARSPQNED